MSSVSPEFKKANDELDRAFREIRHTPATPLHKMNQGQLMGDYRYNLDMKEAIEAKLKLFTKNIADIKEQVIELSTLEGVEKFASDDLTATVKEKDTVKITGDWGEIQEYLIGEGMAYVVQRRITESKLADAFYDGSLRLPKGLDIGTIRTVTQRRK